MDNQNKAIVASLPDLILEYQKNGRDDEEIIIEDGYVSAINGKNYFIHIVATIPVKEYSSDLEFGLWVEVSREDFFKYVIAKEDKIYANFEATAYLANDWPGFPNTCGDQVQIKVLDVKSKPQIINIQPSDIELAKYIEAGSVDEKAKGLLEKRIELFYMKAGQGRSVSNVFK